MHGRSRMTIDIRSHPYNARTERAGFSPTRGIACTKREAAARCWASRMKGELRPCILLRTAFEADLFHMDDSVQPRGR